MDKMLASTMGWPKWATDDDSHYRQMKINELWLRGKQYDHLQYSYVEETDRAGHFLKHYEKRPSIRLHLPALAADMVSRKLFATSHAPVPKHKKRKVLEAVQWLVKTAKINRRMLEASFWGQTGSVALIIKVVDDKPCIKIWEPSCCLPSFKEDGDLDYLRVVHCVLGVHFKSLPKPITKDCLGQELKDDAIYWYIREWNQFYIATMLPIPEDKWDPEEGNKPEMVCVAQHEPNPVIGTVPALWLRNLDGGDNCDGRSTFALVKSTCVDLDLNLSQMSRGLKFASAPTPIIKGRILNHDMRSGSLPVGPNNAIHIPADKKEGPNLETSGNEVKLLEMKADAVQHGMEQFVAKVKMWTQELMSMGMKDPDTIKGNLSGTAMKLLGEETIDMVQAMQTGYGDEGELVLIQTIGAIMIAMKHEKFKGVTTDDLDELELEYPTLYEPTPDEQFQLAQAIETAITAGIQDTSEGRRLWEMQIGKSSDMIASMQDEIEDMSDDVTPGSDVSAGDEAPPQGKQSGNKNAKRSKQKA